MSELAHGLAPKMKPISRRRSAIVCALDIGTSKIVLRDRAAEAAPAAGRAAAPHPFDRGARHRPRAGARHEVRRRGRHRGGRGDAAPCGRSAPSAWPACMSTRVVLPITAGRTASELFAATVHMQAPTVERRRHRARARRRQPSFGARGPRGRCIRCRSATRSTTTRGIRDPRGMIGAAARRRHARGDRRRAAARNLELLRRALPSRRRGDGRDALCRRAFRRSSTTRPSSARAVRRYRRRHDDDRGVRRRPLRPCRRHRASAASTSRWTSRAG